MSQFTGIDKHWRNKAERFARFHGFYWLPCVLCGEPHGGQEATGCIATDDSTKFQQICPSCTAERQHAAEKRLAELDESITTLSPIYSSTGRISPKHRIPSQPTARRA